MNYAKCATCHGLNSMGFCQYTACRFPETESGVITGSAFVPKTVTHADRIRSMTDEKLAGWFSMVETDGRNGNLLGINRWLKWLKQEVSE